MKISTMSRAGRFALLPMSTCCLLIGSSLPGFASGAPTDTPLPDDLSAAIQRTLGDTHLAPIWQVGTPFPGTLRALQADSRKQQMQSWFLEDGVHIVPSCCEDEQTLSMRLASYGRDGNTHTVQDADPQLSAERVEYHHAGIVEWYVNQAGGLEQGFDIATRPFSGDGELELVLDMGVEVQLTRLRQGRFLIEGSSSSHHFTIDGLKTIDASGRLLDSRFETRGSQLVILVDDSAAQYPITVDPTIANEHAKLTVGAAAPLANFGHSMHQSSLRAVVGAPGTVDSAGAAYVYKNLGNGWELETKLTDASGEPGDGFGASVALTNDSVLIGAWGDNEHGVQAGTVHEFKLNGTTWSWNRQLQPQNAHYFANFGSTMKVAGSWLFVGSPNDSVHVPRCGSVQVFEKVAGDWQFSHQLCPSNLVENDGFGRNLAVNNTQLAVSAPARALASGTSGEVFLYEKEAVFGGGLEWKVQQSLGVFGARSFGFGLDWAGSRLAVGAPLTNGPGFLRGAVYFYDKSGTSYQLQNTIYGPFDGDRMGESVAIDGVPFSGMRLLAGAPSHDESVLASGVAYMYLYDTQSSNWNLEDTLRPTVNHSFGAFGYKTHLVGSAAFVASMWQPSGGYSKGRVDLFNRNGSLWNLDDSLFGSDRDKGDLAGWSVALEDGIAVVGVPSDDDTFQDGGSAWVFWDAGSSWYPVTRLSGGGSGHTEANFGTSVAIKNGTIVVGAVAETGSALNSGSAHVFEGSLNDGWQETGLLAPNDSVPSQRFGHSVAVDGDTIVVGATEAKVNGLQTGAAYVFRKAGPSTWNFEQKLSGANSAPGDLFGNCVDVLGSVIAVGAPAADPLGPNTGEVRVFRRSGNSWSESEVLVKAHDTSYTNFGKSLSLDANRLFVGSPGDFGSKGLAQIYTFNGSNWVAGHEFTMANGAAGDRFGEAVDMQGSRLLVGAPGSGVIFDHGGQAVLFQQSGPDWLETRLIPSDRAMLDGVGSSVAISGQTFLVGAPKHDIDVLDEGAAYLFEVDAPDPFQVFGLGDGSFGPCPCNSESPVGQGAGCRNSTGAGARMVWQGSASLAANDMVLGCEGLPANKPVMLFMGTTKRATGMVLGDGLLGMSGALIRVKLTFADANGTADWSNLHSLGYWIAGQTRMFQSWYRDPASGPCGAGFNLSSGVQVSFLP